MDSGLALWAPRNDDGQVTLPPPSFRDAPLGAGPESIPPRAHGLSKRQIGNTAGVAPGKADD